MRARSIVRNRFVLIGAIAPTVISVSGSFALGLDVRELPYYFPAAVLMCAIALAMEIPTYYFFRLREVDINDLDLPGALIPGSSIREASQPDITFVI